ncbi:porin [uncultured Kriegella sp.]|uniref:porin n=1 Tax=uncultured Kriegella sp. TaxID=1798910 RepID=UPI0030D78010
MTLIEMKSVFFSFLLFSCLVSSSQETPAPKFGNGILNLMGQDSTWSMKIGARMQLLSTTTWDEDPNGGLTNSTSNALIRRARLKFDGFAYSPKLTYKIELGLSNRDLSGGSEFTSNAPRYILDAVVMWNFYKNFEVWFGQTKLPGNMERIISSGNLQQVDRSLLNQRFTIDREMGVQLWHHFNLSDTFMVREKLSIANGEGRNVTSENLGGHHYTARLELFPFGKFENNGEYSGSDLIQEQKPKLMLAGSYDINQNAVKTRSNQGTYMVNDAGFYESNINTVFIDAMFKYKGFSFMGEYAYRSANDPIAKNSDGTETGDVVWVGNGLNLQSGFLFTNNWEISGRYTCIDLDKIITGRDLENQYTLGLSKYIVGHKLKVQTDLSYLSIKNNQGQFMGRLQVELHF